MTETSSPEPPTVRSVLNALRILEEVSRRQPIGVSELARRVGLPKSSTHRSLRTLSHAGWVRPTNTEAPQWVLTHRPLTVGLAGSMDASLRELAMEEMAQLRDATSETVHLAVPDGPQLVIIARLDGTNSLRTFLALGTLAPMHATATGRSILSVMPKEKVERILDAGLERYTRNTLTDRRKVLREVEAARRRGYAINAGEWRAGIAAIGVPILSASGKPVAAFGISMPTTRYREMDRDETARLAIDASGRITERMRGWPGSEVLPGNGAR